MPADPPPGANVELWDGGRLQVCREFAVALLAKGLTTFDAVFGATQGVPIRSIGSRSVVRLELDAAAGVTAVYLKRYGSPRWTERIRPWLHFARPRHGAQDEWEAIHAFRAAGIPTMTPIAFGQSGARSFVMTLALPARCNLLEFVNGDNAAKGPLQLAALVPRVADVARRMHAAGWHHQDFYLNHFLLCETPSGPDIRVIDLGRVRRRSRLGQRWIIKDLAQLHFSARKVSCREKVRFLQLYLGRRLRRGDRRLIRVLRFKSQRIAAHTAKHDL